MQTIPIDDFNYNIFRLFDKKWLLLTAGDFDQKEFNTMTVAWGFGGIMWNKPMAVAVVRPVRHTYKFMEKFDTFTLTAFPEQFRPQLNLLGTKSGRDGDKIAEAGLTPVASKKVATPGFAEAELIIECRKAYFNDFNPLNFLDRDIEKSYPRKDYHRVYYGEIQLVRGTEEYTNKG